MYWWLGICDQFRLCSFMLSFITLSKLIVFVLFYCISIFVSSFLHNLHLLVLYANISVELIDCIFFLPLGLDATLLSCSLYAFYLSLLNLSCDFNINFLLFISSLHFFLRLSALLTLFCPSKFILFFKSTFF